MEVQVTETRKDRNGVYVYASCKQTSASVAIHAWGVQVCCHNAAHKVWRGSGKHFSTLDHALAGYRSAEMRAIIQAAASLSVPA
jgi:hypothetical protein